ncbi:MAG TPA: tagaturonate epimerase family protein [Pirellulales bacterium]|nr:tagaturonate epimerase family protein [Pirellulales bacterium]
MNLQKFSFGMGDRFMHQGKAQLAAVRKARDLGVEVAPVWNKSHREHRIVGSGPESLRREADLAVRALGWDGPYFVDADHIGLKTVDDFLAWSDFFTIDVADSIGQPAADAEIERFVAAQARFHGRVAVPGIEQPLLASPRDLAAIGRKYLAAAQEAGRIYRHIAAAKGVGNFVAEVSMDETDEPQTPVTLLFILAALAAEKVPLQTIAPKFTGRFNKGVDYVGDVARFEREFADDIAVIAFAVREFGLPADLKLSVHSGSDKFSIYGPIRRTLRRTGAGLHLKTAGTTWLEELIGLAVAGGSAFSTVKEIYRQALDHIDALCEPYAAVIDIDRRKLPAIEEVADWSGEQFVGALRHDPRSPRYNPHLRQLLHVGYKVAAQMGDRYYRALEIHEAIIAENVTENLFERHLQPLLLAKD